MTLQQLDSVLNSWKERLSAIAENLMELQSDATYQSLTGTGGLEKVAVTGATAARAGAALGTMNGLFLQFGLLQSTVERAGEIRSGLPCLFGAEAKLQALYQLLLTRSIDLDGTEPPLAERHLLSGTQHAQRVSPEELLNSMTQTFVQVRDAVATVGNGWALYGSGVDRLESELARYRSQAALPSGVLAPMIDAVEGKLSATKTLMQSDPLGALAALKDQVEPALAQLAQRITAAETVNGRLLAARSRWQTLEGVHREAVAVAAEARARLTEESCPMEPLLEAKLQALSDWLERLDRKRDEGATEAVMIGLRNWAAAAEVCATQDRELLSACESQLALRGELRGRLEALEAKARARGVADQNGLRALHGSAATLLSAQPTDLRLAREAVGRFEEQLRRDAVGHGPVRSEAFR